MMKHATLNVVTRRVGAIPVAVFALAASIAGAAQAQAPGSVFGQQPQQLSPQFQPPPSSSVVPLNKPTSTAPNWNAVGSNPAPTFTPPPAASTQARRPATPASPPEVPRGASAKPSATAKNLRPPSRPAGPKVTKFMPNRTALLQAQIKIRDEENRIAQGLRGHALGQEAREKATGGAFAQTPGRTSSLAAAAEVRSPLAARNSKTQDALAAQPDGIWSINGRQRDFVITPGGNVVIFGKGFGSAPGRVVANGVKVLATTDGNISCPNGAPSCDAPFHVTGWNNFEIDATLPTGFGVRGIPDRDGIVVQVVTSAGKSFTLGNGKFVATREEITLPFASDAYNRFIDFVGGEGQPELNVVAKNWIDREQSGTDLACGHPGVDQFYLHDLPNGFQLSGMTMQIWTPTDTGDGDGDGYPGNHMLIGSYSLGEFDRQPSPVDGKMVWHIPAYWGIYRAHRSPAAVTYTFPAGFSGRSESDSCRSNYVVVVSVVGPAGLTPY